MQRSLNGAQRLPLRKVAPLPRPPGGSVLSCQLAPACTAPLAAALCPHLALPLDRQLVPVHLKGVVVPQEVHAQRPAGPEAEDGQEGGFAVHGRAVPSRATELDSNRMQRESTCRWHRRELRGQVGTAVLHKAPRLGPCWTGVGPAPTRQHTSPTPTHLLALYTSSWRVKATSGSYMTTKAGHASHSDITSCPSSATNRTPSSSGCADACTAPRPAAPPPLPPAPGTCPAPSSAAAAPAPAADAGAAPPCTR